VEFKKTKRKGKHVAKISGNMLISEVTALKEQLLDFLKVGGRLALDLGDVYDCDTAGVQLLLSACKSAEASGKTLTIESVSTKVQEAVALAAMDYDVLGTADKENRNG
jgi:anti-anti-sigma factor